MNYDGVFDPSAVESTSIDQGMWEQGRSQAIGYSAVGAMIRALKRTLTPEGHAPVLAPIRSMLDTIATELAVDSGQ